MVGVRLGGSGEGSIESQWGMGSEGGSPRTWLHKAGRLTATRGQKRDRPNNWGEPVFREKPKSQELPTRNHTTSRLCWWRKNSEFTIRANAKHKVRFACDLRDKAVRVQAFWFLSSFLSLSQGNLIEVWSCCLLWAFRGQTGQREQQTNRQFRFPFLWCLSYPSVQAKILW